MAKCETIFCSQVVISFIIFFFFFFFYNMLFTGSIHPDGTCVDQ